MNHRSAQALGQHRCCPCESPQRWAGAERGHLRDLRYRRLFVEGLKVRYPIRGGLLGRPFGFVKAVDGVDLTINRGESVALVGETGCGKSTLGASVLGMTRLTYFDGKPILYGDATACKALSRDIQIVFRDPVSALNPKTDVGEGIGEPMAGSAAERKERAAELLSVVGLHAGHATRKPNAFLRGQRQRIVIVHALALNPKLMIHRSAGLRSHVSIRSQILNPLLDLHRKFGLSCLFISYDLSVVRHFADRVAVKYLRHLVETGRTGDVFSRPVHPYTETLRSRAGAG